MEDVKKRGLAIDEADTASGDEVAAAPKKRGRPANPNKPPVKPSSGRGRGRPAKNAVNNVKKTEDSDEAVAINGEKSASGGRGRPRKAGKPKLSEQIVATGKGRGRPKKATPSDVEQSDDNENDDDEKHSNGGSSVEEVSQPSPTKKRQKLKPAKSAKKLGRPRKAQASDEESDEDDERQPVGRPATGAVNLNIERTGRGQGRPKKNVAVAKGSLPVNSGKRPNEVTEGTVTVPKKRGRPSLGHTPSKPSGKPRGRPKSNSKLAAKSDEDDEVDDDDDGDDDVEIENGNKKDDENAGGNTTAADNEQADESDEEDLIFNADESTGE